MQNVLIDVFNDLRARRLLPVAAVLLVALVAAPIVLSKKSDGTPTASTETNVPTQSQAPQGPDELAQVTLSDDLESGSSLSAFSASDPFAPPKKVLEAKEEAQQPSDQAGEPTPSGAPEAGGGTTPGETTPGGTAPGTTPNGTEGGGEQTTEFKYVLDVTFWVNGKRRKVEGMEKLDVLPSQVNPLLIFMGASSGGAEGVFLVDSTLQASGEGACKPSDAECAFLALGAGSEEEFTDEDGNTYRLRIDEIRKVKVDQSGDSNASGSKASRKKSKSARAAVEGPTATHRFAMPDLADLVVVTGADSTGNENRR